MKFGRRISLPAGILLAPVLVAGVAAVWLAWMGDAVAHGGATGVVKQRMDAMGEIKAAMKALKATLPDAAESADARQKAVLAAELIRDRAGTHMTDLFPEGSLKKPSEATPAVWQDWTAFQAYAGELRAVAGALAIAVGGDGSQAAGGPADLRGLSPMELLGRTAETCKSCHKDFRER